MSVLIGMFDGPLHWTSKRQNITASTSAEAEIYATDECVKDLIHFHILLLYLNLLEVFIREEYTITVYNDNMDLLHCYK